MIDQSLAHPRIRKGRKARTNRGMFASLERNYWRGALTDEQQATFEDVVRDLRRLYKSAAV